MCSASPPNQLYSLQLDSVRLLFSWRDPDSSNANCTCKNMTSTVTLNRIIRRYTIKVTDDSTGDQTSYRTDDRHLLLDNLQPHHQYTFRVAIDYATNTCPYSQPLTVILNSTEGKSYKVKLTISKSIILYTLAISYCNVYYEHVDKQCNLPCHL